MSWGEGGADYSLWSSNIKMNSQIYQRKYGNELYTLEIKKNGKIICNCVKNLYNPKRDYESNCKHAKDLHIALKENNLKKYIDVTPENNRY
jgi:hypothetical protein